jgi:hypothetical protein
MHDPNAKDDAIDSQTPISLSHFVHTLVAYRIPIIASVVAVGIVYAIVAIILYLRAPSERITSQAFRLEFNGATLGQYPNGLKFSSTDIVALPTLLKVYDGGGLARFISFEDFSRSVFVLQANPEYELLAAEYQARLADPKLSTVDRERIAKEWESKRESLSKSDYSINMLRTTKTARIPETVVRKTLVDILSEWAASAIKERRVLTYPMFILSPEMLDAHTVNDNDYVVAIEVLRSKVGRVLRNIDELTLVPGAELARTTGDQMSLQDITVRLDEMMRFQLEPLVNRVCQSGLMTNPAATTRFLESQLGYDQRQLKSLQDQAESVRDALAVYSLDQRALSGESIRPRVERSGPSPKQPPVSGETLMPQLSDTFIDRLMTITSQAADVQYRQKMVFEFRRAKLAIAPLEKDVAYDTQILNTVRALTQRSGGGDNASRAEVHNDLVATTQQVRDLLVKVNEIYQTLSRNMYPSTQLYSLTAPPTSHTERSISISRLALYGILTLLFALSVSVLLCLAHNRIREEEVSEGYGERVEAVRETSS